MLGVPSELFAQLDYLERDPKIVVLASAIFARDEFSVRNAYKYGALFRLEKAQKNADTV